MILAKVTNRVVSSAKLDSLSGQHLLEVVPTPECGGGLPIIALNGAQAGPGDLVLVMQEGTGAREVLLENTTLPLPAQAVIVGVVDSVER